MKKEIYRIGQQIIEQSKHNVEVHYHRSPIETENEFLNIEIGERITISALQEMLVEFFGLPNKRVTGSITMSARTITIVLFKGDKVFRVIHCPFTLDDDLDPILSDMTIEIMREISPYILGAYYFSLNRYDAAIAIASDMVGRNVEKDWAYSLMCMSHFHEKQLDAAISDCEASVKINPTLFAGHANLGNAFLQKGIQTKDDVTDIAPGGRIFVEKAAREFRLAAALIEGKSEVFCNLSAAYDLLDEHAAAQVAQRRCP